jgi:hypothetical protein
LEPFTDWRALWGLLLLLILGLYVAYVLPTVKNGTQTFPTRDQDENWFIVLPPRHDWKNMLWLSGI